MDVLTEQRWAALPDQEPLESKVWSMEQKDHVHETELEART